MKLIKLTQGKFAKVDDEDCKYLNYFRWQVQISRNWQNAYAVRQKGILMHREILGLTDPKIKCDHIDHNGLNNQRSNLRIATHSQNMSNITSHKNSSSQYLGVSLYKSKYKNTIYYYWNAQIEKENKRTHLGYYKNEIDAAIAYNNAAIKIHGEFANLNIII